MKNCILKWKWAVSKNKMKIIVMGGILLALITIFLIPLLIELYVFRNPFYSAVSNDGWASFLGSYSGGILGGVFTFIGVLLSLKYTSRAEEEKNRPILILKEKPELSNANFDLYFHNIGKSPCLEIRYVFYEGEPNKNSQILNSLEESILIKNDECRKFTVKKIKENMKRLTEQKFTLCIYYRNLLNKKRYCTKIVISIDATQQVSYEYRSVGAESN